MVISVAENIFVAGWAGLLQMAQSRRVGTCSVRTFSRGPLCPAVAAVMSLVFVLGGNPFFHPNLYLLTRCLSAQSHLLTAV